MIETIESVKKLLDIEREKNNSYEKGEAKLYYSLQRKMSEMADMLNKTSLLELDIAEPKDKTFERMKAIWNDASSISIAVKSLGDAAGVTGDEKKDTTKSILDIAESRK